MFSRIINLFNFSFDNPWGEDDAGKAKQPKPSQTERPKRQNTGNGNGQNTIQFDDLIKKYKEKFSGGSGGSGPNLKTGKGIFLSILIVIFLWLLSGMYTIQPDEQGVILRFGKYDRASGPGLHYKLL